MANYPRQSVANSGTRIVGWGLFFNAGRPSCDLADTVGVSVTVGGLRRNGVCCTFSFLHFVPCPLEREYNNCYVVVRDVFMSQILESFDAKTVRCMGECRIG